MNKVLLWVEGGQIRCQEVVGDLPVVEEPPLEFPVTPSPVEPEPPVSQPPSRWQPPARFPLLLDAGVLRSLPRNTYRAPGYIRFRMPENETFVGRVSGQGYPGVQDPRIVLWDEDGDVLFKVSGRETLPTHQITTDPSYAARHATIHYVQPGELCYLLMTNRDETAYELSFDIATMRP